MVARRVNSTSTLGNAERGWSSSLLLVAGVGWVWSISTAHGMKSGTHAGMNMSGTATMSFAAFLVSWVAMMTAMMLPAILPVVRLYSRAAARRTVAPVAVFLAGYGIIWSLIGIPVFFVWRALEGPISGGSRVVARVAGTVLIAAALYQLSPLKSMCLRHCRSPMSFFLRNGARLHRPSGAVLAGVRHGLYCLGCCWMLMAILVAFGTMQLVWMAALAVLIVVEKATRFGDRIAIMAGAIFFALGSLLLIHPQSIGRLT